MKLYALSLGAGPAALRPARSAVLYTSRLLDDVQPAPAAHVVNSAGVTSAHQCC